MTARSSIDKKIISLRNNTVPVKATNAAINVANRRVICGDCF